MFSIHLEQVYGNTGNVNSINTKNNLNILNFIRRLRGKPLYQEYNLQSMQILYSF